MHCLYSRQCWHSFQSLKQYIAQKAPSTATTHEKCIADDYIGRALENSAALYEEMRATGGADGTTGGNHAHRIHTNINTVIQK